MNKKRIFATCMTTLLSSCAGFATDDFETPQKAKVEVGGANYVVTPGTKDIIENRKAAEILSTPAIKTKIKNEFASKRVPDAHKQRLVDSAVENEKLRRLQILEDIRAVARQCAAKITILEENKKMQLSAEKRKKAHEDLEAALEELLLQKTLEVDNLGDNVSSLNSKISNLISERDGYKESGEQDLQVIDILDESIKNLTIEHASALKQLSSTRDEVEALRTKVNVLSGHLDITREDGTQINERLREMILSIPSKKVDFTNNDSASSQLNSAPMVNQNDDDSDNDVVIADDVDLNAEDD